jgi:hypothetical protein
LDEALDDAFDDGLAAALCFSALASAFFFSGLLSGFFAGGFCSLPVFFPAAFSDFDSAFGVGFGF